MNIIRRLSLIIICLVVTGQALAADRFETCREKLIKAQQLDVLKDLDWKPGKTPKVVVGPTFSQLPFDAKEGFAETVNCFLMGGKDKYIDFPILEYLNHKVVAEWTHGRLKVK